MVRVEQKNITLIERNIYDDGPYEFENDNFEHPNSPVPAHSYLGELFTQKTLYMVFVYLLGYFVMTLSNCLLQNMRCSHISYQGFYIRCEKMCFLSNNLQDHKQQPPCVCVLLLLKSTHTHTLIE